MSLTREQVKEFRKIYKKKFGKDIDHQEALEKGNKFLTLMRTVYKPIKQDKQK